MRINRHWLGVALIISLSAIPAMATDDKAIDHAFRVIRQNRLLSPKEAECVFLMISDTKGTVTTVDVREKHNKRCGGAPEVSPRRFSLEIDLKTGAARWDNNPDMEMRPIPRAR